MIFICNRPIWTSGSVQYVTNNVFGKYFIGLLHLVHVFNFVLSVSFMKCHKEVPVLCILLRGVTAAHVFQEGQIHSSLVANVHPWTCIQTKSLRMLLICTNTLIKQWRPVEWSQSAVPQTDILLPELCCQGRRELRSSLGNPTAEYRLLSWNFLIHRRRFLEASFLARSNFKL
jgi:hypothetical protein